MVLPVELDRNMRAAIEIGKDAALKSDRKGGLLDALLVHREPDSPPSVEQFTRRANQAFRHSHRDSSRGSCNRASGRSASNSLAGCAP